MKIVTNERRGDFRLLVPVIFGYQVIGDGEFHWLQKYFAENKTDIFADVHQNIHEGKTEEEILFLKRFVSSINFKKPTPNTQINETVNLSVGGIAFHSCQPLEKDGKFILNLNILKDQKIINIFCKVCESKLDKDTYKNNGSTNESSDKTSGESAKQFGFGKQVYLIRAKFEFFNSDDKEVLRNSLDGMLNI